MHTVIRIVDKRHLPLRSFYDENEAIAWAKLQMKFLNREYDYYIAKWDLQSAPKIEIEDRRLKVIK